jgi:lipid II:glycine glycyltransferase (peptidoglycan interpeptide bridge formation enzyme)
MSKSYHFEKEPTESAYQLCVAHNPFNPFQTMSYARARARLGDTPWVIHLLDDENMPLSFSAFTRFGRLNRTLEITSCPEIVDPSSFMRAIRAFCKEQRITLLAIDSFASRNSQIPEFGPVVSSRERYEFLLHLDTLETSRFCQAHKRNLRKAQEHGLELRTAVETDACFEHMHLFSSSMERRAKQGAVVPLEKSASAFIPLVEEKAAKIFQAVKAQRVLSSSIVLIAPKGAYYYSAGTREEGRECGASHFLVAAAAQSLAQSGAEIFNLGGAKEYESGLMNFKAGFGAEEVMLRSAVFKAGGALEKLSNWLSCLHCSSQQPAHRPSAR